MSFAARSVITRGSFRLAMKPDDAFPLFSPRGEEAWAPGWTPEMLAPADGSWVAGQVFRTTHAGESVWFVASLDTSSRRVVYDRVDVGRTAVRISVLCEPSGSSGTEVHVSYAFTGLSDEGNAFVGQQSDAVLQERVTDWRACIEAALQASGT